MMYHDDMMKILVTVIILQDFSKYHVNEPLKLKLSVLQI